MSVLKEAVYHKIDSDYAYPVATDQLMVRLRCARDDLDRAEILFVDKYLFLQGRAEPQILTMEKSVSDELFDYYERVIPHRATSMAYCFVLHQGDERLYYGNYQFFESMFHEKGVNYTPHLFIAPEIARDEVPALPEWVKDSIIYQVFPDSFHSGSEEGWRRLMGAAAEELPRPYGGTLRGVTAKLSYLHDLGINTLYLNPLFKAKSYHKYDTSDHFQIDPQFGTRQDLCELVDKAHDLGMKVLLDGVFSATGVDFFAFRHLVEHGPHSPYADWYDPFEFPIKEAFPPNYRTFGYAPSLPKLNFAQPRVVEYCLEVLKYWIRETNIDGWRLDVADEVPHSFWRKARQAVDSIKKGTILVGEVWYDSSTWLGTDQFHSVMNYLFYTPVKEFFALGTMKPRAFSHAIGRMLATYREPYVAGLWNLLGSHDTARFLHEASHDVKRLKLAAAFQFTFVGAPVIYYGDEVGMSGGNDPGCRAPMCFDDKVPDPGLLNFFKQLVSLRKNTPALSRGRYRLVAADDETGLFTFERAVEGQKVRVCLNCGKQELEIDSKGFSVDLMTGCKLSQKVFLGAMDVAILLGT
jgi:glycosidase